MKLLTFTLLLLFPLLSFSQVIYNNNTNDIIASDTNSIKLLDFKVPPGENRILVVSLGYRYVGSNGITSFTFSRESLQLSVRARQFFSGSVRPTSAIWYVHLGSGDEWLQGDIEITFLSNVTYAMVSAASYQNVDPSDPIGATSISTGTQSTSSVLNVPANDMDLVVDNLLSGGVGAISAGSNQEEISNLFNQSTNGSSYEPATGGNVMMSWAKPFSSYTHAGMALNHCNSCNSLPVELLHFYGKSIDRDVKLFWETANEVNNDGFEIQHSKDGLRWKPIGFVAGHGSSEESHRYEFEHQQVVYNNNYYRLKQIDFEGTFDYSEVINISTNEEATVRIYPNPAQDFIQVKGIEKAIVSLLDQGGCIVAQQEIVGQDIDIAKLPSGVYFVTINTEQRKITKRLIKN